MEKRSIPNQPVSWQQPFVDVFKKFSVFDSSTKAKKGSVAEGQVIDFDSSIGRRVVKIQGSVSASNYVNIPDPQSGVKALQLIGRYIYLEFLPTAGKFFNIHFDFNIQGRDTVTRLTLSNMFDQYKVVGGNCLQIPYPSDAPLKWTVLVLDVTYHLENFGLFEHSDILDFSNIHSLRTIQMCSTIVIRGIYTSDICYTTHTLPKELDFKPPKDKQWSGSYQIVYYPSESDPDCQQNENAPQPTPINEEKENQQDVNNQGGSVDGQNSVDPLLRQSQKSFLSNKSSMSQKQQQSVQQSSEQQQQQSLCEVVPPVSQLASNQRVLQTSAMNTSQKNFHPENLVKRSQITKKGSSTTDPQNSLQPYPICKLNQTLGFSGNSCPDIKWSRSLERPDELIYASGSILISSEIGTSKQRFFQGHSSAISCMDISRDGKWIVSGQEGKNSIIRIWDFLSGDCIIDFVAPHHNAKCVSFSCNNKSLATVGLDNQQREVIIIWDLENIVAKKEPEIITKQISDFNILCLKFSPVDKDQLVSCGKENIRFWRVKNQYLRGTPVVLNHQARNTVFTVLDFEFAFDDPSAALQFGQIKRVFVGSKQGMIFQINYATKQKQNVYYCHEGAITSLSVSAGFCVTGSEDLYMRVWPLDLSESLIEAKHEGVLISLDVSADALRVACGTSNGGLGVLDLSNNKYDTLLRSHTEEIIEMHVHPFCNYLITLSTDFTIRLWDMEKYEQVYEFPYPPEDRCTTISCCSNSMTFTAGYSTGVFRVFDIEKTDSIFEGRYHEKSITHIQYSPDSKHLIVADENSFYCLYDVARNYQPVKTFEREIGSQYQFSAFSPDSDLLAFIGDSGTHINIVDTYTLGTILKIFTANTSFRKLLWSSNNTELFALTDDCKVKVFGIDKTDPQHNEAFLLREVSCTHRNSLEDVALSNNCRYMASVGGDNLLKVWDYEFALSGPGSNQVFLSHVSKINCIAFSPDNAKIFTAGGFEGIYEWSFLGDLSKQERTVDFSEYAPVNVKKIPLSSSTYQANPVKRIQNAGDQQPLTFDDEGGSPNPTPLNSNDEYADIRQVLNAQKGFEQEAGAQPFKIDRVVSDINDIHQNLNLQVPLFEVSNSDQSHPIRAFNNNLNNIQSVHPPEEQSQVDSDAEEVVGPLAQLMSQQKNLLGGLQSKKGNSVLTATSSAPRFVPTRVEPVKAEEIEFHKQKKKRDKRNNPFRYAPNQIRKDNNLPFRHYYLPNSRSEAVEEKNLKLRDNKEEFQTECIVSFNNDSHDNVVWNYIQGWFAYSTSNIVIVETLSKTRNQKIVNLPDQISCMNISKDFKFLVVGSASYNQKELSNIYVIDCKTFEIVKTLSFHTRGVQSIAFSASRKHIVSIGNCKECTIAIWEWPSGKLLTSSYTLDRINDLKISEIVHSQDNILEFCTVGRDTIQFWALDKSETLKYFDVFVPKQEFPKEKNAQGQSQPVLRAPEIIAVDYIVFGTKQYAVAGLSTGEIIFVDNEEFEIVYRTQVSLNDQPILDVRVSNIAHRLIVTALDENIHYWDFERQIMESKPFDNQTFFITWARLKISSSATSFFLDPSFNEGLCGLYSGGVCYVNLSSKYRTTLAGTIDVNYPFESYLLNDRLLATCHSDGRMKLWNTQTAEEVMEYKFAIAVSALFFEAKTGKIFCFFANGNEIKILNSLKFYQAETYLCNLTRASESTSENFVTQAFEGVLGGKSSKFAIMKNGDIFSIEQLIKNRQQIIRHTKVHRIENLVYLIMNSRKSMVIAADSKANIQVFIVDYEAERANPFSLTLIDECAYLDNPHGSILDATLDQQKTTNSLYKDSSAGTIKMVMSEYDDSTYYAIISSLQYVFVRNYQKRQILQRINLHDFPLSIAVIEDKKNSKILVGLQNGSIEKLSVESKDQRDLFTCVLEGGVTAIQTLKSNNPVTNVVVDKVITSSQQGIAFYSF